MGGRVARWLSRVFLGSPAARAAAAAARGCCVSRARCTQPRSPPYSLPHPPPLHLFRPPRFFVFQYIEAEDRYGCHNYAPLPVVLARGSGVHVWDVDGKR
jgi:hypothetical protein